MRMELVSSAWSSLVRASLRCAVACSVLCTAAACSRSRVESINRMNEGVVLAQQGRLIEAIEKFKESTVIDPSNDEAFYNLGLAHMESHKFIAAAEDFRQAIKKNATNASYHEKLGTVLMESENWQEAEAALKQALELDGARFKVRYKLARVHESLANPQQALYDYTESIMQGPRFFEAYVALANLYLRLGYLDHAIQVAKGGGQVAQPKSEEEARLHHILGTAYQKRDELAQALKQFEAALAIAPGMPEALFSAGWTAADLGQVELAKKYLGMFTKASAGQVPAHYITAAQSRLAELESAAAS